MNFLSIKFYIILSHGLVRDAHLRRTYLHSLNWLFYADPRRALYISIILVVWKQLSKHLDEFLQKRF